MQACNPGLTHSQEASSISPRLSTHLPLQQKSRQQTVRQEAQQTQVLNRAPRSGSTPRVHIFRIRLCVSPGGHKKGAPTRGRPAVWAVCELGPCASHGLAHRLDISLLLGGWLPAHSMLRGSGDIRLAGMDNRAGAPRVASSGAASIRQHTAYSTLRTVDVHPAAASPSAGGCCRRPRMPTERADADAPRCSAAPSSRRKQPAPQDM